MERNAVVFSGIDPDSDNKNAGVYTIAHSESGRRYHGSSDNIHRRLNEHRNSLARGAHGNKELQELAMLDGRFSVAVTLLPSQADARAVEEAMIISDGEQCVNVSTNTDNPLKNWQSNPEMRARLVASRIGNNNAGGQVYTDDRRHAASERMLGNTNLLGHQHSDETRKRMSDAKRGVPKSEEAIRKAALGRSKGTVTVDGVMYPSMADASRAVGMTIGGVKKRCESDKHSTWVFNPK